MASAAELVRFPCVSDGGVSADKLNVTYGAQSIPAASLLEICPQIKPSDAIKGESEEIRKIIESYGFVTPGLFGSTARGEDVDGSDLDLLATIPDHMAGQISLFDIANLQDELERMLGVVVDFNIENNMPEIYRAWIEPEVIKL